ncbi:MAG: AMP-binding protein, partial [Actinomycetota bacterium]
MGVKPMWAPSPERVERANLTRYLRWLRDLRGLSFGSYDELWRWSVDDLDGFWSSIWEFFEVGGPAPSPALAERRMPGARWFPGATLNHAELSLRRHDDHPALLFGNEAGELGTIGYAELGRRVAAVAAGLRRLGVEKGDRVVAYLPNVPETVVAMLATASLGAVWSSCAPEFGVSSVVDRFAQIEPKVLVAVDGYRYGGAWHDRRDALAQIRRRLPTLQATVLLGGRDGAGTVAWEELLAGPGAEPTFEPVAFDHPLWVLYSSGTTGLPKAIVHGHGGIALELLKSLALHLDLGPADRFLWFTTTGWMMWNFLVGGLLLGATVVLYDGSPGHPDMGALWRLAASGGLT